MAKKCHKALFFSFLFFDNNPLNSFPSSDKVFVSPLSG